MTTNHTKPVISLRNFLDGILDYAGLFPPASLSLGQAFHNYVFYLQGEYKWMLGKFIIPANRLKELASLLEDMEVKEHVSLSVIGSSSASVGEFEKLFSDDILEISSFLGKYGSSISVGAFEVRLPAELFKDEDNSGFTQLMESITSSLEKTTGNAVPVYFEAPLTSEYETEIIRAVENIGAINKSCGFKLRTGGTEPSAFPEPEVIAFAIMTCCEFDVPMKCTAGLHHPVRHYNEEVKSNMHGFLNVFSAGIMAYSNNLDEAELIEVLSEEDPYEFIFNENGFEWNEIQVSNDEIKGSRERFMLSYGSCSFDEPVEDLKTMELF